MRTSADRIGSIGIAQRAVRFNRAYSHDQKAIMKKVLFLIGLLAGVFGIHTDAFATSKLLYSYDNSPTGPTNHGYLYQNELNGSNRTALISDQSAAIIGMEYDQTGGKLYRVEYDSGTTISTIIQSATDLSNPVTIYTSATNAGVYDVAVDSVNGNIYWTEYNNNRICRASTTGGAGQSCGGAFSTGATPVGIAVDGRVGQQKIYYATATSKSVRKMNLDGTGDAEVLNEGSAVFIYDVAVDTTNNQIFYGFASGGPELKKIAIGASGSGSASTVVNGGGGLTGSPTFLAIDNVVGKIYWIGAAGDNTYVQRSDVDGSDVETLDNTLTTHNYGSWGITLVLANTETISGTVYAGASATGVSGVTIDGGALGSATTDSNGDYSFTGITHGASYTLTPSFGGQTITPSTATGTVGGAVTENFRIGDLPKVYVTDVGTAFSSPPGTRVIKRLNTDGTDAETLITDSTNQFLPFGITIDSLHSLAFYCDAGNVLGDQSGAALTKADLDLSSGSRVELDTSVNCAGLAIDPTNSYVYYGDVLTGTIYRINYDGTGKTSIVNTGAGFLWAVAIDVSGGKIYWADNGDSSGPTDGAVKRANLSDGSSIENVVTAANVSGDVAHFYPSDIQIDSTNNKIYISQQGDSDNNIDGFLKRANLDGTGLEDVIPHDPGALVSGFALDVAGDKIYFVVLGGGGSSLYSSTLDGGSVTELYTSLTFPEHVALLPTYSITGTVLDGSSNPVSGVSVSDDSLGAATTASDGTYTFPSVLPGTSYTLTPTKTHYSFTPTSSSGTVTADMTEDFTATAWPTLSGTITYNSSGLGGVTVNSGTSEGSTTTAGNGTYSFQIEPGTSYTITPSKTNYVFSPTSRSGTMGSSNTTKNFTSSGAPSADIDGDGLTTSEETANGTDPNDSDSDDDGIEDGDEVDLGTDPTDTDSDNDGVEDGQEQTDGTNPLDGGSYLAVLSTTLCSEWNGFLGGMYNIFEHTNLTGSTKNFTTTVYDISGTSQGSQSYQVLGGAQTDVLVHGMTGWTLNSYGKVCSHFSGSAGDIDGRMVYYKPASDGSFEFAFAMPVLGGLTGSQFVAFNTYQPSLDAADASNLVANWIQITNQESSSQNGTIYFYGQDGSTLLTSPVSLSAGARSDFSGHQFGANHVGQIEWRPSSSSAHFTVRNVRYYYDNDGSSDHFDSAFQLEARHGSGELMAVPLDTRSASSILEVLNTRNASTSVTVKIYNAGGTLLNTMNVSLPAYGSQHIITDTILNNELGVATVDGSGTGSVVTVVMQYGRTASAGIQYIYGISAQQGLGSDLKGTYNTFLQQDCSLLLINPTSASRNATVSMRRYDGTSVLSGQVLTVPAKGIQEYNLCANDIADVYGVVTVQPTTNNTIIAHVVRQGASDSYRFPTPVRQ